MMPFILLVALAAQAMGSTQRARPVRHTRALVVFLQRRLDSRRDFLRRPSDRPDFLSSAHGHSREPERRDHRHGLRSADRRVPAIRRAVAEPSPRGLSLPPVAQLQRPGRAENIQADGACRDRRGRRSGERSDQQQFRFEHPGQRPRGLAQLRVSLDAVSDRRIRRRDCHGHPARHLKSAALKQIERVQRDARELDPAGFLVNHPVRRRADSARPPDHRAHLPARRFHRH